MRMAFGPRNPAMTVELETERFILRPVSAWHLVGDPGGWRTNRHIYRNLYFEARPLSFRRWLKLGPFPDGRGRVTYAIVPRGQRTAIGYYQVRLTGWHHASNAVGIHDAAWLGRNVAVETRARIMNHYFNNGGVQRFSARIAADNAPSIFTYRRLGFAHVGTLHRERASPDTGAPLDFLLFEMLKEDWMRGPFGEPGP